MTDAANELLPADFDPAFYRESYPDLASMDDAQLEDHFRQWGQSEGRIASIATTREGFLAEVVNRETGEMLEIGPFCRPLIRGPNVRYLDVLDADGLRARATEIGIDPSDCPETIDYVGDLDAIDHCFDAVVSSHAIEHQPDVIHHLQSVARLLKPGGRYFLIIPDKRYCFDALIPESTIAQVIQAHRERRTRHTMQSVIEHRAMTVHNDGARHWQDDHGPIAIAEQARRIGTAIDEYDAAGESYIDVHAWYWTPSVFRRITELLFALRLSPLRAVRVFATPANRFEFCAILERPRA